MDTIRKTAFPTPSPFGPEYERQRIREAYELLNGWWVSRMDKPIHLRASKEESLRILSAVVNLF